MGFKRTTEGRVFFQRSKETANDQPDRDAGEPLQPAFMPEDIFPQPERPASGPQEILAVLRALNERLKSTQSERQEMRRQLGIYRTLMEELEEKAERSERAWLELEEKFSVRNRTAESRAEQAETIARDTLRELEETRRIVADLEDKADLAGKSVSSLKKLQAEQDQKLSGYGAVHVKLSQRLQDTELKQEDMGGKIEEALSQQARLGRKLDKAVEDRARFMRKIERIEETVIQTRDALNARAMVLLTDQAAGGGPALEEDFPPESMLDMRPGGFDALPGAASTARSPWFQAVAVGAVMLAAALAGWFAAELRRPGVCPVSGDFSITEPRNLESPNS
ncbi:MAG: hypothetical protein K9G62_08780, partial [Alphaproteobacteria bacterium]|nr:hypothetical protein [Alphaproteobacteria bacterium]